MSKRYSLAWLAVGLAIGAVSYTAWAEPVYKWTDQSGRVHYSNTPPKPGTSKVQTVDPRVSTFEGARTEPAQRPTRSGLEERVNQLEREAAQERGGTSSAAADAEALRRWQEQCRAERRVDCDDPSRSTYSYDGYYYPPAVYPPVRPRPPFPPRPTPVPGVAQGAGGVVGPYVPPPPGGYAPRPGSAGIGLEYQRVPPQGQVIGPGTGNIGLQYYPAESVPTPPPRPTPRPTPYGR